MDCRDWENQLDDFLTGKLSAAQQREAEAHLAGCPHCRGLLGTVHGNLAALSTREEANLTETILSRTSGSPCGRAQEHLSDLVTDLLPESDTQLVRAHLEHCRECQALAVTLTWVLPELGEMAELNPGPAFTAAVLRATTGARWQPHRWPERISTWWQSMIARPRFALEAAYVGMLLLIALFGTPLSPYKETPGRALEFMKANPVTVMGEAVKPVLSLGAGLAPVGEAAWDATGGKMSQDLQERHERAAPALASCRENADASLDALFDGDWVKATRHFGSLWQHLGQAWRDWNRSGSDEGLQEANGLEATGDHVP
jgi:hypothetical protein